MKIASCEQREKNIPEKSIAICILYWHKLYRNTLKEDAMAHLPFLIKF
jgi:hypothetical protein